MLSRTIRVSDGEKEFLTAEITERNRASITSATFQLALGTHEPPSVWKAADTLEFPQEHVAHASLLIDDTFTAGSGQWLWYRVTDLPEILIGRIDTEHIILV